MNNRIVVRLVGDAGKIRELAEKINDLMVDNGLVIIEHGEPKDHKAGDKQIFITGLDLQENGVA